MEIKRDRYLKKIISFMWDGQVKGDHRHSQMRQILSASQSVQVTFSVRVLPKITFCPLNWI